MKGKFIKKITKEGKRKVINIPKENYNDFEFGEDVIVKKIDLDKVKFEVENEN